MYIVMRPYIAVNICAIVRRFLHQRRGGARGGRGRRARGLRAAQPLPRPRGGGGGGRGASYWLHWLWYCLCYFYIMFCRSYDVHYYWIHLFNSTIIHFSFHFFKFIFRLHWICVDIVLKNFYVNWRKWKWFCYQREDNAYESFEPINCYVYKSLCLSATSGRNYESYYS